MDFSVTLDLLKTYAINFAYVLLRAVVYAVACFLSWIIIDRLAKINLMKQVTENQNMSAGIVIAALLLGLAHIIAQV
jgi:hypothetical protein